jgi:uncharacterized protein (DUF305 family)
MRRIVLCTALLVVVAVPAVAAQVATGLSPAEQSKLDGGIPPYTAADVAFMQGMIGHHGQAVVMARWAVDHDARADIQRLAQRIEVAQSDEIAFMQVWLRNRKQHAPEPSEHHTMHQMPDGMTMRNDEMLMPGMLAATQLAELDNARGSDFDRLFLTYMIRHHEGAILMVETLFDATGPGQDDDIFKFASDVSVDQTTEVDRMQLMLKSVPKASR